MMFSRLVGLAAVALLLILGTATAEAAKKKVHTIHGTIADVQRAEGKDSGTITVKIKHQKKGATVPAQEVDRKFKVTSATKMEFVKGKKGAQEHTPAKFTDVQSGEQVVVVLKGDVAEKITIHQKGKKKAKD